MITNPSAIYMAVPQYPVDNIIGITTGSFNIAAPTFIAPTTATDTFDTGFGDTCLFQGIFSVDNGASQNDFGVNVPNLSTPGMPVLQTVTCYGGVLNGVFTAYGLNFYDNVHSVGTAYTILYKVVFFAKSDQNALTTIPNNQVLNYSSEFNYQKVYLQDSFANVGMTTSVAISLGYIPKVREWITVTNNTSAASGFLTIPAGTLVTPDWFFGNPYITVSTTSVNFISVDNGSTVAATVTYRIYLDS